MAAWEREAAFVALGRELAAASRSAAVRGATWQRKDLERLEASAAQRYDLVVLGHVLNELRPEVRQAVVEFAWRSTAGLLLIVEPGTSAAFPVVRAARDHLLTLGAHTIAPCAHDRPCPLAGDWCHFPQRVVRPDFQRRARSAPSPWEDSKFSYAAMARFAAPGPIWARIIDEPASNKAYAEVKVSSQTGIARLQGLKRHREAYRYIRGLFWGDSLSEPPAPPVSAIEETRQDD
jgi:ribosomal protein RSM22 (predicted rRNA methylase)